MTKVILLMELAEYLPRLREAAPNCEFVIAPDPETRQQHLPGAEVVLGWDRAVESCCLESVDSPLRWIQSFAAGVDYVPLDRLAERGIALTTASGVHGRPIAESVFAMMLAIARGLPMALANQRTATWDRSFADGLGEIHGSTLGILGTGSIGGEVARTAKAFSMTVLGMNTTGRPTDHVDWAYAMEEWEKMLPQCDHVVNILPLTPLTRGFVDGKKLEIMKPSACYFSVGRGATTDTRALTTALESGGVAAAGLDVVDPEPVPADSPLWSLPNVLLTPHISGLTPHYDARAMDIFVENLVHYCQWGRPCRNLVDHSKGY